MLKRMILVLMLSVTPFTLWAEGQGKTNISSMVIFGDSLSDNGNITHLLKSLNMEEDPAYLVNPLKLFVYRKMDDFADAYYVPASVLMAGKKMVQEFFDIELAPILASMVGVIKKVPSFPEAPYWEHHFADGYVWNERLALKLGLNLKDEDQYYNYAYGGSWAATYDHQLTTWNLIRHPVWSLQNLVQGKLLPPSLGLEVSGYLMERGTVSKDKVFFLFAGGNDYLNMLNFEDNYNPSSMSDYVDYIVDGIIYSSERLVKAGASHLVVLGVPDIGSTPRFNRTSDSEILTKASSLHNERLGKEVQKLREKYPEVTFSYVNIQAVLDTLLVKAKEYGITDTKHACIDVPLPGYAFTPFSPHHKAFGNNFVLEYMQYMHVSDGKGGLRPNFHECNEPKHYAFWDEVHPTARVHQVLADEIGKSLVKDGYIVTTH
jgi:phospholipase/lecithinase/hemolysin